jgi:putative sigma-54 modulation protein
MEIRVQSVKFDADQKLLDFIDKKVSKLSKFDESVVSTDVVLSLLPDHDNKNVKIKMKDLVVERNARTFEDAVVDCVDVLKEKLVRVMGRSKTVTLSINYLTLIIATLR